MELVIAEKPSVARDLARVLGVRGGGGTQIENDRYVVTWCIGHLVELEEPAAYDPAWKAWRLDRLPMLPAEFRLRPAQHAIAQLRAVMKLLADRRFEAVINACDAGREGELIFRYVYQHASSRLPIRRLWISSLTDEAIRRGMSALRPGADFSALGDAARSRSEADWLVGMNATRAITARNRDAGHDTLSSIGRVQTPTLAMLVERERELRAFVPKPYWEVRATLPGFTAQWRDGALSRLRQAEIADAIVARDTAIGAAIVERVRAKTVREPPPQLFDLTSLQRTANRRFGFSAQRTLELAQALYERHKLLTYPRTDSRHLTQDVAAELVTPFTALAAVPEYAPFASVLLANPPRPNRRVVDDTKVSDHHAIIPTGAPIRLASLDRDEGRLFDLVARRFLGAFFPDAEFASTEAWLRVGTGPRPLREATVGEREAFVTALPDLPDRYLARGRVRLVAGWQDVAGIDPAGRSESGPLHLGPARPSNAASGKPGSKDETDDESREPIATLPVLVEGQTLDATFAAHAKQTTPPPRYTEATLLGAMETAGKRIDDEALRAAMKDTGLGTPATRASIIETLLRRSYIERDRNHLVATDLGMNLIATIPIASLASAELTGTWEARLAAIARGTDTRAAFMADIARYVTQVVDAVRRSPAPPPPPPGSTPAPAPAWQSRGKGKRPRGRNGSWKPSGAPRARVSGAPSVDGVPPRASTASAMASAPNTAGGAPKKPRKSRAKKTPTSAVVSPTTASASPHPSTSAGVSPTTASASPRPPTSASPHPSTSASPRPLTRPAVSTTRDELSIASTAWLSDLVLAMAPPKDD